MIFRIRKQRFFRQELLVYMEDYLNQLLDKFNGYRSIVNYCREYIFEDEEFWTK